MPPRGRRTWPATLPRSSGRYLAVPLQTPAPRAAIRPSRFPTRRSESSPTPTAAISTAAARGPAPVTTRRWMSMATAPLTTPISAPLRTTSGPLGNSQRWVVDNGGDYVNFPKSWEYRGGRLAILNGHLLYLDRPVGHGFHEIAAFGPRMLPSSTD